MDHIARIAVRNPTMVEVGRYFGLTLASCVPADPQSKGGSEATVRIASADLVPTDANLLPDYASFVAFRRDCDAFCERVNARPHSVTKCPPIERLAQERERLHPLPADPYTAAFGLTRGVGKIEPVINFDGGEYSVPDDYVGQTVWVRRQDDEIVIVHVARDGRTVNGKSILDLTTLAAECGTWLDLEARGSDAEAALVALDELISASFHEAPPHPESKI